MYTKRVKYFGLLALLLTIYLGTQWYQSATKATESPVQVIQEESEPRTIGDILDSAEKAADTLSVGTRGEVVVYDGIAVSKDSTILSLSGRGLTGSLKAEVRHLSSLETLDLSDNSFTGLPAEVGQLSQLRVLDLSGNPFTGLPHEIGNLQKLELLDLRDTNVSAADVANIKASLPATTKILTN